MEGFSMGELVNNLVPAILAGVIGGCGAYVAVKVDIAVLLSNQAALIEQGKIETTMVAKHETKIGLLQYQVEGALEDIDSLEGRIVKR